MHQPRHGCWGTHDQAAAASGNATKPSAGKTLDLSSVDHSSGKASDTRAHQAASAIAALNAAAVATRGSSASAAFASGSNTTLTFTGCAQSGHTDSNGYAATATV